MEISVPAPTSLAVLLVGILLGSTFACVPARRAASDEPSARPGTASPEEAPHSGRSTVAPDASNFSAADASSPQRGDSGSAVEQGPPLRPVVARAPLADVGEVRVEVSGDDLAFRLAAASGKTLSVEPLLRLSGPSSSSLLLGPGCLSVPSGREADLAIWTGRNAACVIASQPVAVVRGTDPPRGCEVTRAAPGSYTLTLFSCGRYADPLGTVTFDLAPPTPAEPPASDGGAPP